MSILTGLEKMINKLILENNILVLKIKSFKSYLFKLRDDNTKDLK